MRKILPYHKKGVSELISYTLLIVIAIAASVLVYNYLKVLVPKDRPNCPDGASLIINNISCTTRLDTVNLTIEFQNKGRFTFDAVYVRVGDIGKRTKTWINRDGTSLAPFYFIDVSNATALAPGDSVAQLFSFSKSEFSTIDWSVNNHVLEVQPAMDDENTGKLATCNAISQTITCVPA